MRDILRLMILFRRYRLWMLGGVALSLTVILSNVALMALSGWFITSMAMAGLGLMKVEFFTAAAAIRGLALLRTIARYIERLVTHDATLRMLSGLRLWLFEHLAPLAPSGLEGLREGDLLTRIQADVDSLDNFYLKILAPAMAAAIGGLVIVAGLWILDPRVAVLTLVCLVLAGVGLPLVSLWAGRASGADIVTTRAAMGGAVTDLCRGLAELQIAGATRRQIDRVTGLGAELIASQRRNRWIGAAGSALSGLAGQLAMWGALVLLVPRVASGGLAGPDLAMIVLAVAAGTETVGALPAAFAAYGTTAAAARRIFALADQPVLVAEPAAPRRPESFGLSLSGVTMRYEGAPAPVLRDFGFELAEGEVLGLVGPSGAGKTTVLELLQRFRLPETGEIRIGGVPLNDIAEADLRTIVTAIGQNSHVFAGTIRENLLIADPEAADEALWQALRSVRLEADIRALPQGLDTVVGERAARLSGGQARRLCLARAFLRDAPVVLLDEPTEGLDAASEALVTAALADLVKGRTAIVVSHRPGVLVLATRRLRLG